MEPVPRPIWRVHHIPRSVESEKVIVIVTICPGGEFQRDPHHDVLLHCDVCEGERSSVDQNVAYAKEAGLEEITQPDIS